jgi:hypothetical protein
LALLLTLKISLQIYNKVHSHNKLMLLLIVLGTYSLMPVSRLSG